MSQRLLFNGAERTPDLGWSRGLHYGDGIFRTCLIYDSQVIDLTRQLKKAFADAGRLGLEPPATAVLEAEAHRLAQGVARGVLKLLLVRAGGQRGYRSEASATDRLWCLGPAPAFPAACWERGVHAARGHFGLAAQPALAGIKHLNRLEQVLASRQWPAGIDEVLVSDAAGNPHCGTRTNLFWVARGVLRTPALDACGVAGLMRDKVLAAAQDLGLPHQVAPGSWAELEDADEAFVTNSVVGVWPLASLGTKTWDGPGAVTRQLTERLRHPRLVTH